MKLNQIRMVVFGDGGAGNKTACIIKFVIGHFVEGLIIEKYSIYSNYIYCTEYDPTIEDSYTKKLILDGEPVILEILDTAG